MRKLTLIIVGILLGGCSTVLATTVDTLSKKPSVTSIDQSPTTLTIGIDRATWGADVRAKLIAENGDTIDLGNGFSKDKKGTIREFGLSKAAGNLDENNCYTVQVNFKTWNSGAGTSELLKKDKNSPWCLNTASVNKHYELNRDQRLAKNELEKLKLSLSTAESRLSSLRQRDSSFSLQCREPKPPMLLETPVFCSDEAEVSRRQTSCEAPILKRACRFTAEELIALEKGSTSWRLVPAECAVLVNGLLDQHTSLEEVGVAYVERYIYSKLGGVGTGLSYLAAIAKRNSCLNDIKGTCNPTLPEPPNCNSWNNHNSEKTSVSREIEKISFDIKLAKSAIEKIESEQIELNN